MWTDKKLLSFFKMRKDLDWVDLECIGTDSSECGFKECASIAFRRKEDFVYVGSSLEKASEEDRK